MRSIERPAVPRGDGPPAARVCPRARGIRAALAAAALAALAAAPAAAQDGAGSNQDAAAAALDSLSTTHPLADAITGIEERTDIQAAFDQLSGEVHASAKSAMVEEGRLLRRAGIDRLRAAADAVAAPRGSEMAIPDPPSEISALAYETPAHLRTGPVVAPVADGRIAVWSQTVGAWGSSSGDGNAAGMSRSTGGVLAGADTSLLDPWRLGVLAGVTRLGFDVSDRASTGSSDNYHFGLYAGRPVGPFALRAGAAHTWHDASTYRSVAFAAFSDTLAAAYQARSAQLFGELGYGIHAGPVDLEPFAAVAYVDLQTDAFAEAGGAAALASASSRIGVAFGTLGLRGTSAFTLAGVSATIIGSVARHAVGDTAPSSTVALAGGDPFTVAGVPAARGGVAVDAGLDVKVTPRGTLGVSYGGQFAEGSTDQTVRGRFALSLWPGPAR